MVKMGKMLRARYGPSAVFSNRELDRNAAGRGKHQIMVDGGMEPGKGPLIRELCDVWAWKEEHANTQTCEGKTSFKAMKFLEKLNFQFTIHPTIG